jgi:large subunit ribosomal protein L15
MFLNTLKPAPGSKKQKVRVGRGMGSGKGKTCGTGHKGQKSRGRSKVGIGFEGGQMPFHRRIPKSGFTSWQEKYSFEVRLSTLEGLPIDRISLETLKQVDLIPDYTKFVKVIATGVINRSITVANDIKVTKGAKAAIEAAGGKIEE